MQPLHEPLRAEFRLQGLDVVRAADDAAVEEHLGHRRGSRDGPLVLQPLGMSGEVDDGVRDVASIEKRLDPFAVRAPAQREHGDAAHPPRDHRDEQ